MRRRHSVCGYCCNGRRLAIVGYVRAAAGPQQRIGAHLCDEGVAGVERPGAFRLGQRQRVAIARALAIRPSIVLADEPTANLDHNTGEEILNLMKQINRSFKTTFIFSTHDKRVIAKADRLVRVNDGEIYALGVRSEAKWFLAKQRRATAAATQAQTS